MKFFIFLFIASIFFYYAYCSKNNATQCMFTKDPILCVQIIKANERIEK